MLFNERPADPKRVHDGKQTGPPIPVGCGRLRVGKQIADIRMALLETRGGARPNHGVKLSVRQQVGTGYVRARILDNDVGPQVEIDLLARTWVLIRRWIRGDAGGTN